MNKFTAVTLLMGMMSSLSHADIYTGINLGINAITVDKHLTYPLDDSSPQQLTLIAPIPIFMRKSWLDMS